MNRIGARAARKEFAELMGRVAFGGERVIVERNGKGLMAWISVEDLLLLEELEDRADVAAARRALAEPGESVPYEKVRRELGLGRARDSAGSKRRARKK